MAFDELIENLQEANVPVTDLTSQVILLPVGSSVIYDNTAGPGFTPTYPEDLIEIQQVSERLAGTNDSFVPLVRRDFREASPAGQSLLYWTFQNGYIMFNPSGANTPREIQLKYICDIFAGKLTDENSPIGIINSISYLSYKTASLCAHFIGENESRAAVLDEKAEKSLERMIGISNKGKQQIMTRHRPFRSGYKSRGWI